MIQFRNSIHVRAGPFHFDFGIVWEVGYSCLGLRPGFGDSFRGGLGWRDVIILIYVGNQDTNEICMSKHL